MQGFVKGETGRWQADQEGASSGSRQALASGKHGPGCRSSVPPLPPLSRRGVWLRGPVRHEVKRGRTRRAVCGARKLVIFMVEWPAGGNGRGGHGAGGGVGGGAPTPAPPAPPPPGLLTIPPSGRHLTLPVTSPVSLPGSAFFAL